MRISEYISYDKSSEYPCNCVDSCVPLVGSCVGS